MVPIRPTQMFRFVNVTGLCKTSHRTKQFRCSYTAEMRTVRIPTLYPNMAKTMPEQKHYHHCMWMSQSNCHSVMGNKSLYASSILFKSQFSSMVTDQGGETIDFPDFSAQGQKVLDAAKKVDVMAGSVPMTDVITLLKELHALGFDVEQITTTLSERVWLLRDPAGANALFQLLQSHGFLNSVVVQILQHLPITGTRISVQDMHDVINTSLENLRKLGFSENELQFLLASEPGLLFTDSKTLNQMLIKLKGLFTSLDALQVVKRCPNVLADPWSETNRKFDYAYFTMGYKQPQIVRSQLFSHSFEHIQDRHIFLHRAGFFVAVKEKDDPKTNPNPPLTDVVDSPDKVFVKEFGDMSVEDYQTFLRMREFERENEEDESENLSEESESDSDEEQEKEKLKGKWRKGKKK